MNTVESGCAQVVAATEIGCLNAAACDCLTHNEFTTQCFDVRPEVLERASPFLIPLVRLWLFGTQLQPSTPHTYTAMICQLATVRCTVQAESTELLGTLPIHCSGACASSGDTTSTECRTLISLKCIALNYQAVIRRHPEDVSAQHVNVARLAMYHECHTSSSLLAVVCPALTHLQRYIVSRSSDGCATMHSLPLRCSCTHVPPHDSWKQG